MKIRKRFRELKDKKIRIRKELEDLYAKTSMLLLRPEKAFHQKPVPLARPRTLTHLLININSTNMDEFEETVCKKVLGMIG